MRHLYIDPGDVHVGMAEFTETGDDLWACTNTWEIGPNLGEEMLTEIFNTGSYDLIGYERFQLFGHLAQQQAGSEFRIVQFIGVLRYLQRLHNPHEIPVVIQNPSVQKVAEQLAKARGIPLHSVTTKQGNHAKSAELHGIYHLCRYGSELVSVFNDRI